MKRAYFVCLILLSTTFLLSQSNSVPLVNQTARVVSPISVSQADPKTQAGVLDSYGKLPLSFEANHGQTDARVKFLSRTGGYSLFLTGDEAVLTLRGSRTNTKKAKIARTAHTLQSSMAEPKAGGVLRMKLRHANLAARVTGMDELPGMSNYFIGNDPAKWRTNVPTYAKVKYEGIYSGIDLVYYGNQRQLEYDFVVAPGADPRRIAFDVRGAKRIRRDQHGDLVLKMTEGEIRWHKPVVYQEKSGTRQEIAARYITGGNRVAFELAKYDASRPLYIDPLIYSTYLGGQADDAGQGIAVDSSGNAYVVGTTYSTDFPTKNPLQPANGGEGNAFVAELNPTGSALVYSTYLGGSNVDEGLGIAVDSVGDAYVTGATFSIDFPIKNPLQAAYAGGDGDAFVAEISPMGSALIYSTYLGGSGLDWGRGIAVDSAGNAYVTGQTESADFPTKNPLQSANGGNVNVFVAKVSFAGSALVYSTYLGGSNYDYGLGIAADRRGNAYVTGNTNSVDFPTRNPLQPALGGYQNAFVARLNPSGSALVYSTYLGGSGYDGGNGIAVDSSGNAYVTGFAGSTDFPTKNPLQPANGGEGNAFVAELNPTGSAFVYSTYLGGSGGDEGYGIAVDGVGNAFITGYTGSSNFPTKNPLQAAYGGDDDAFVVEIGPTGSALVYSTYLGGSNYDYGLGIAADRRGNAYVTGLTLSSDFPTMNPLQRARGGGDDAFVAKIASQVTFASLIELVNQFDTKPDVRAIMVFTLELAQAAEQAHAAKLADALLDAFIDEVSEQSGKSLTAAQAAILIHDAKALMMPT